MIIKINQIFLVPLIICFFAYGCEKSEKYTSEGFRNEEITPEHLFELTEKFSSSRAGMTFFSKVIAPEIKEDSEKEKRQTNSTFEWFKIEPVPAEFDENTIKHYKKDVYQELGKLALKTGIGLASAFFGCWRAWDITCNAYAPLRKNGKFSGNWILNARLGRNLPLIFGSSMASAYLLKDAYNLTKQHAKLKNFIKELENE